MSKHIFKMNNKSLFKVNNTKRHTRIGVEYILSFRYMFPSSFMKYFDTEVINCIQVNLNDKKEITLFVNEAHLHNQSYVLHTISVCCEKMMDAHLIIDDAIVGPVLIERITETDFSSMETFKRNLKTHANEKSVEDIKQELKILNKRLKKYLSEENYMAAADVRDKINIFNEQKTST